MIVLLLPSVKRIKIERTTKCKYCTGETFQRRGQERTAVDKLRHLLLRLSESGERYTTFFHESGVPWTNNRTEQSIGRMEIGAKSIRGYKTRSGMFNGLLISSTKLT